MLKPRTVMMISPRNSRGEIEQSELTQRSQDMRTMSGVHPHVKRTRSFPAEMSVLHYGEFGGLHLIPQVRERSRGLGVD